ncbi:MAG: S26 family signal peptidase [Hyphomonadaceae bacterium]|nr:S26 family signal peptidase [Hyphomonadaceae bacterium]
MKWLSIGVGFAAIAALILAPFLGLQKHLIWNRTASAPIGFYWVKDSPVAYDRWAVLSPKSDASHWAETHGFVGKDWPLLKAIAGLPGDKICREDQAILINGEVRALAVKQDHMKRDLPVWSGCHMLSEDEIFLLNAHPKSLDGRYFGVTRIEDVDGIAVLLFEVSW